MARPHPTPEQPASSRASAGSRPLDSARARLDRLAQRFVETDSPAPTAIGIEFLDLGSGGLESGGLDTVDAARTISVPSTEPTVELAVRQLPGNDVLRALAGFVAPPSWHAFAIVAPGRAFCLDTPWTDPVPVRTAYVLDRRGRVAHRLWGVAAKTTPTAPPLGRIPDACRRVLGIPTAAADQATTKLWILDWLDRSLSCALQRDLGEPAPTWPELAALDRGRSGVDAPWAILRREVAAGSLEVGGISAGAADWMDDGLFCREVLADFAECGELLRDLRGLLRPATYRRLLRALVARARDDWAPE
jgi:hypothetical protein